MIKNVNQVVLVGKDSQISLIKDFGIQIDSKFYQISSQTNEKSENNSCENEFDFRIRPISQEIVQ